jgi:hypothetical protein
MTMPSASRSGAALLSPSTWQFLLALAAWGEAQTSSGSASEVVVRPARDFCQGACEALAS